MYKTAWPIRGQESVEFQNMTKKIILPGESHDEFTPNLRSIPWAVCLQMRRNCVTNEKPANGGGESVQKLIRPEEFYNEFPHQFSGQSDKQFIWKCMKTSKCDGWTDEQMDKAIAMSPSNFIGRGKQQKNQPKNKEK